MSAPTPRQIEAQVAAVYAKFPHARIIGLRLPAGPAEPGKVWIDGRELPVARCDSVLALRERLTEIPDDGPPLVLLTSLREPELGADVVARLARRALFTVEPWQLVKERFRARYVDPRLSERHAWVAPALLDAEPEGGYAPVASGFLDAETVWKALFSALLGTPGGARDAETLLEWGLDASKRARLDRLEEEVRDGLRRAVRESAGELAGAVFDALVGSQGARALAVGLVARVLHDPESAQDSAAVRAAVRLERFHGDRPLESAAALAWADAAEAVVQRRLRSGEIAPLRPLLADADALLARELEAGALAFRSRFLPSGYEQRLDRVAALLEQAVEDPGLDPATVWNAVDEAFQHALAPLEPDRMERIRMAARTACWLARSRGAPAPGSFQEAAEAYRAEGGFADWARSRLWHGDSSPALGSALSALSAAVDGAREHANRHFGRLAAGWSSAGPAGPGLVPVEAVLDRIVAPLALRCPTVLIVVDGMAVSVFRELQRDLAARGWVQLVGPEREGSKAVIAAFPSVTQVSRASLLCGRLVSGLAPAEKEGFERHPALVRASEPPKPPVLFHKAELQEDGHVGVAPTLLDEIADLHRRVVGVVVNAVDDHLARGDQIRLDWTARTIRPLEELLRAAGDGGRTVVLVSDHGHVLEHGTTQRAGAGERWREAQGTPAEDEILLEGPRVLLGGGRIFAPWTERVRYGGKKNGYHGGVAPQEVVIPLGVFAPAGVAVEGWREAPDEIPAWWEPAVLEPAAPAPTPRETPKPRRPERRGDQGSLFPGPAPAGAVAPPAAPVAWIETLLGSEVLVAQRQRAQRTALSDERLRAILEALDERGGRLTTAALARRLQVPALRIAPILSAVRRLLNVDGFAVIEVDETSETVSLNRALLDRQFGL